MDYIELSDNSVRQLIDSQTLFHEFVRVRREAARYALHEPIRYGTPSHSSSRARGPWRVAGVDVGVGRVSPQGVTRQISHAGVGLRCANPTYGTGATTTETDS